MNSYNISMFPVGGMIGAMVGGLLGDKLGRRMGLLVSQVKSNYNHHKFILLLYVIDD